MAYSFDGVNKVITLSSVTNLNLLDLWSRWSDWVVTSDNSKFPFAFTQIGGNDIDATQGTSIPIYLFLTNGWRVRPQESDHTLSVSNGVLIVDGGGDPFLNTIGDFTVRINYQQPVQAITVSTGGSSGASAEQIAQAMWDYLITNQTQAGSMKELIESAKAETSLIPALL